MKTILFKAMGVAAAIGVLGATSANAVTVSNTVSYSLGDSGNTLVRLGSLHDTNLTGKAIKDSTGATVTLDAISYRPATREYYGYSDKDNAVYKVNPNTGVVTFQANFADATNTGTLGMDFNNVLDAARVVSQEEDNLVYFPNNDPQNIIRATDLFYVDGDVNAGQNPGIVANAYTNAVANPATTQQFVLDATSNSLATLGNNAGTLSTIGTIKVDGKPFDFLTDAGLDILSLSEDDNTAYALLSNSYSSGIYHIPLIADASGNVNASLVRSLDDSYGLKSGLTIAAVPVPASGLLLGAVVMGAGFMRRRKLTSAA